MASLSSILSAAKAAQATVGSSKGALGTVPALSTPTTQSTPTPVLSASQAGVKSPTSTSGLVKQTSSTANNAAKTTASGNAVVLPNGGYMPLSQTQLSAAASADINAQLQAKQAAAAQATQAANLAYANMQTELRDNRTLEDGHFDRTNAPASWDGSTGYRGAMMDRNRSMQDTQLAQQYAAQLAAIQQGVTDYQSQMPSLIQAREAELKNQERNYGLDYAGVYGADPTTGQKTSAQINQDKTLALNEGQLTGTYLSPELSAAYDTVMAAKQEYAAATTQQARQAAMNKANAARATITKLGGNADLVGANVSYDQATGNSSKFGVQTQAAKEYDTNLTYQQGRDKVADQQYSEQFAYQKARDAITDGQWKLQFDENVRQYGLNYALDKLSQENQQAYQQAQLALAQDDNTRAWAAQTLNEDQFTYQQLQDQAAAMGGNAKSASPTEVKQLLENFQLTGQDSGGNKYKYTPAKGTPARTSWIESTVDSLLNAGYDNASIDQVLKAAGISDAEQDEVLAGKQ